jgi:PhnB protein
MQSVTSKVKPIPPGYHSVTPYLSVQGVPELIDFLKHAFHAEERERMTTPDGRVSHAEVKIGDSIIMMGEPTGDSRTMPGMIYLYLEDTDAAYRRAIDAGATSLREPSDMFYGDRNAAVTDSAGNQWWIATHQEDVPPQEMERRMKAQQAKSA